MEMRNTTSYGLSLRTLPRSAWNLAQYAWAARGPLASNVFESTAFIRSHAMTSIGRTCRSSSSRRGAIRTPFPLPLGHGYRHQHGEPVSEEPGPDPARERRSAGRAARRPEPARRSGRPAATAAWPEALPAAARAAVLRALSARRKFCPGRPRRMRLRWLPTCAASSSHGASPRAAPAAWAATRRPWSTRSCA